jgi:hypothetical protein
VPSGLNMIRCMAAIAIVFCCAHVTLAASINSLDLELSVGSSNTPHDSYAWPVNSGQSCTLTTGGTSIGGRNYSGYSDPFVYQVSGSITFSAPDMYTIDIKVWSDGNLLLPTGVTGSDGFPLDRVTLYVGGAGLGDRDGLPDTLNPDLNPADDHFRIASGSYFKTYNSSTSTQNVNLLDTHNIAADPTPLDGWSGDSLPFSSTNVRLILFRLRIQEVPEPATAALFGLALLVLPRRRARRSRAMGR